MCVLWFLIWTWLVHSMVNLGFMVCGAVLKKNWPSLHFYGLIILVKKKGLCIGKAWLLFQKSGEKLTIGNPDKSGFRIPTVPKFYTL